MVTPLRNSPVLIMVGWAPWVWGTRARGGARSSRNAVGVVYAAPCAPGPRRSGDVAVVAVVEGAHPDQELGLVDLAGCEARSEVLLGRVPTPRRIAPDRPDHDADDEHRDREAGEGR